MTISQSTFFPGLTPCRVVDTANLPGSYFNGTTNNGVGATLTVTALGALTIDSVVLNNNERVLLIAQTNSNENGIYIVLNSGSASSQPILQRAVDMQCIEQMKVGSLIMISAGTVNASAVYGLVEPLPATFGVSPIVILPSASASAGLGTASTKAASNNAQPDVASVLGPITVAHVATFSDVNGTVTDGGVLGTAASKAVSNNVFPTVASVSSPVVTGNNPFFSDANGTVSDSGFFWHLGTANVPGGAATFTITDILISTTSIITLNFESQTNPSSILTVNPLAGSIVVTATADPGVSVVNYVAASNTF